MSRRIQYDSYNGKQFTVCRTLREAKAIPGACQIEAFVEETYGEFLIAVYKLIDGKWTRSAV